MARKTVKRKQTRNRKNKNAPSWSENEAADVGISVKFRWGDLGNLIA